MDYAPLLLQSAGSLVAILALAALAWWLKLGGKTALTDEHDVARAAGEVDDGFEPARVSISRGGNAALARDASGRIMVIKHHGNKFVGRILTPSANVSEEVDALIVKSGSDTDSARFGVVRLSLEDPAYWADAINRL